jgi:hypothetical protein
MEQSDSKRMDFREISNLDFSYDLSTSFEHFHCCTVRVVSVSSLLIQLKPFTTLENTKNVNQHYNSVTKQSTAMDPLKMVLEETETCRGEF